MRTYYPPLEPNRTGFLQVDNEHNLYWEESGNPKGKPILFLHGGPGVGTDPNHRCYFDPNHYRIILFDQRGCGKSTPFSSLNNNTTWALVADIEKLREHLAIDRWVVFGGSWGSTLALCYAIKYSEKVKGLILRGIFLATPKEFKWFYQEGANHFFPDMWDQFLAPIPIQERKDMIHAYYKRLTSSDPHVRSEAARAWSGWEGATIRLLFDPQLYASFTGEKLSDSIARIECHYFVNNAFFESNNWIIENVSAIRKIPGIIVHGRYDIPCPVENAWALHKAWPESILKIIPDAGHTASEPGNLNALIEATDLFREL